MCLKEKAVVLQYALSGLLNIIWGNPKIIQINRKKKNVQLLERTYNRN